MITPSQLLEAIEGVAYLTDPQGTIIAVGQHNWEMFAVENAAPWLTAATVLGTSLFAAINDAPVRDAYYRLHAAIVAQRRTQIVFEYRCGSPIAERLMRMAISPVAGPGGVVAAVLWQSQILAQTPRPPLPLLSAEARSRHNRPATPRPEQIALLCSFCQRVAWPLGAPEKARRWISPVEFYRRGGPEDALVSDSVCPACLKRVIEPNV